MWNVNNLFTRIESSLPQKPGQSDVDRAKDIENTLNWMHNQGFDLTEDIATDPSFDKLGSASILRGSAEDKSHDLNNALNWLRNKDLLGS